jgi:hypothetical protein
MITRTAIIICSPGKGQKYLQCAAKDLRNMKNYLMSPRGGSWHERELFCLNDPSWQELKLLLSSLNSSYQFIYFAGHGCSDENAARYIQLKNNVLVEDTALLTAVPKQLIVIDACRTYYPMISGIPPAEEYLNFTGESSRAVFDRSIQSSPDGKIIIHATQNRAEAAEDRHGRGGAFTLSLLTSALELKTNIPYGPVGIKELLPNVKKILSSENYEQTPTIAYETGDLRVPFLIDTDQITIADKEPETDHRKEAVHIQPTNKFSFAELTLAGLVVFAIVKAFQD